MEDPERTDMSAQASLRQVADALLSAVRDVMGEAKTEEDLRIGVEKALDPILAAIGVQTKAKYERLGAPARTIYRGRPDAVRGFVIIEYEKPRSFSSNSALQHAYEQLIGYMTAEATGEKGQVNTKLLRQLVGVGFDGETIFFVRALPRREDQERVADQDCFVQTGPHRFDVLSASTFLAYLRALTRLALTAEHLADRFGPKSTVAPVAVSAFAEALAHWGSGKPRIFFNEWKRLFGIVYGEHLGSHREEETQALAQLYRVGSDTPLQEMLFCVHSYFALLMKLIAAELITLRESSFTASFCHRLAHAPRDELRGSLAEVEDGVLYGSRGITNFLEGDFFRWYLDAFSPRLEDAIRETARALSEFEPATTIIDPESTRDLLKKLYQYLVPQQIRHKLGEYYTPDWLAELVLDEVGYNGDTEKRLLDPACGSGTFLVLAIQRAREHARTHRIPPGEAAKRILANIKGFDLNPLAVIAARTNYLFALGDLADNLDSFEIPIYLADSVLWPQDAAHGAFNFPGGDHVAVGTSIETFHIPRIWVRDKGFLLQQAAPLVEEMVKLGYTESEAVERLRSSGLVFSPHEQVVQRFYRQVLSLHQKDEDGIWARLLKNVATPMVAGKFDFVVGNPPWIRWGYLAQEYRQATLPLWQKYGLFSLKGSASRLGAGEKDFSMLFTYAVADFYLESGGKLGFLITQEVFKSKGAGEGFRRFRLGDHGAELEVLRAHDLVAVKPFEGVSNKTAAIILRKGSPTTYPVPYIVWSRKPRVGRIPTDATLAEATSLLRCKKLRAQPVGYRAGAVATSWQTAAGRSESFAAIEGENPYKARLGARVEPYGVFWLEIEQVLSDGDLLVRNMPERGKRRIRPIKEPVEIEQDLVFPAVTGADIQRWNATPSVFILLTQDPVARKPYPEGRMKKDWPRTYDYLATFKDVLLSRGSKTVRQLAERTAFYAMFGIGVYTVAPYKVVWKRMANDLVAAVISQHKTPFGFKAVIPTDTTSLFHTEHEDEAHYLCAIINSSAVRDFVRSYSSAGRGFGAPSVMNHVAIPRFERDNALHREIAKLSKQLHELKKEEQTADVERLEKQVDKAARRLFGLDAVRHA